MYWTTRDMERAQHRQRSGHELGANRADMPQQVWMLESRPVLGVLNARVHIDGHDASSHGCLEHDIVAGAEPYNAHWSPDHLRDAEYAIVPVLSCQRCRKLVGTYRAAQVVEVNDRRTIYGE